MNSLEKNLKKINSLEKKMNSIEKKINSLEKFSRKKKLILLKKFKKKRILLKRMNHTPWSEATDTEANMS